MAKKGCHRQQSAISERPPLQKPTMTNKMDWSQFPEDILDKIAGTLDCFADLVLFSSVCRSWRSALALHRVHLPWVLLASDVGIEELRSFYSLSDNRIYTLNFPDARHRLSCGSPRGWLLVYDFFVGGRLRPLGLWNPVTRTQIQFPLVPPALVPDKVSVGQRKLIMSPRSEFLVVMVDLGSQGSILCHRSGTAWTEIPAANRSDFTYYRGRYFVMGKSESDTLIIDPDTRQIVEVIPWIGERSRQPQKKYLVQSSSGEELFLVISSLRTGRESFEVFRLDKVKDQAKWSQVRSIGRDTLFVDAQHAVALPATAADGFCGYRGNCIVFLEDNSRFRTWLDDDACFGLFDIGNDKVESLPYGHKSLKERRNSSSWFIPSLWRPVTS